MSERTPLTEVTQIGVETSPGTGVSANRKLLATSIEPAPKVNLKPFRPLGLKYPTLATAGKDWTEAKITGLGSYSDLSYLLSGILAYATPEQQGTTAAYKWTFAPAAAAEDTIKTFTVESGSSVRAGKFVYGVIDSLGFKITRESVDVSGSMFGQAYQDDITLTTSPTEITPQIITPDSVDVFVDDDSDDLGDTKLERVLSLDFNIAERFGQVWVINSAASGFGTHVETEPKVTLKMLLEADDNGMALLAAARAGTKQFIRLKATGPTIDAPYTYLWQTDLCGLVTEVGEFSDADGVYAIEFTFSAAYDATWGKALVSEVVNTLSGL